MWLKARLVLGTSENEALDYSNWMKQTAGEEKQLSRGERGLLRGVMLAWPPPCCEGVKVFLSPASSEHAGGTSSG